MKLRMGKTTTTVTIAADGALVIECFDFSDEAHDHLGSDVAFTATVAAEDKAKVQALLVAEAQVPPEEPRDDALLLQLIERRFQSYYQIKGWLEEHRVGCKTEFDPWA